MLGNIIFRNIVRHKYCLTFMCTQKSIFSMNDVSIKCVGYIINDLARQNPNS